MEEFNEEGVAQCCRYLPLTLQDWHVLNGAGCQGTGGCQGYLVFPEVPLPMLWGQFPPCLPSKVKSLGEALALLTWILDSVDSAAI